MTEHTPRQENSAELADNTEPTAGDIVDAVYEVALDPSRYDELVSQWHKELERAARQAPDVVSPNPLAEHFERATTILERVHREDWRTDSKAPLPLPELVLGQNGQVLEANPGAAALLSAAADQTIQELDLTEAACSRLASVIAEMAVRRADEQGKTATDARVLRINRAGDDRPLVVLLTPMQHAAEAAVSLRCAEIVWPDSLGPLLANAFDLTGAECEIVQALVAGQNATGIAATRGTSRETVRTQIRELLGKTGTHSQLELIRMTIGFSMMAQQAEARAGMSSGSEDNTTSSTQGTAGYEARTLVSVAPDRQLEVIQYGDTRQTPILVFHDEVIGDAFVLPLARSRPDLHFLAVARYGYGGTTLLSDVATEARTTQSIVDLVAALEQVETTSDAANKPAMRLLAHGNGIYFACRFAAAHPERCSSITTIAPSLPRSAGAHDDSTRYGSFMSGMAQLAPSMLRFAVQAGFAMYARTGPRRFLQTVYGDVPCDRAVIEDDQHMHDLQHGGRLTLAQGYRGFLYDEQAIASDWITLITGLQLPIRVLLGTAEAKSRAERARRLERAFNERENPDATAPAGSVATIHVPAAGFFLAFSAPQVVLDTLLVPPETT